MCMRDTYQCHVDTLQASLKIQNDQPHIDGNGDGAQNQAALILNWPMMKLYIHNRAFMQFAEIVVMQCDKLQHLMITMTAEATILTVMLTEMEMMMAMMMEIVITVTLFATVAMALVTPLPTVTGMGSVRITHPRNRALCK